MKDSTFTSSSLTRTHWLGLAGLLIFCVLSALSVYYFFVIVPTAVERDEAARTLTNESTSYTSVSGESIDLTRYSKSPRVVLLWASWVPSAKQQLQLLNEVAKTTPEVVFIAVNRSEPSTRAQAFMAQLSPLSAIEVVIDTNDDLYNSLAGYAMPEIILFATDGSVVWRKRGDISSEQLSTALTQYFAE